MAVLSFDINPVSFGSWAKGNEYGRIATQGEIAILGKQLAQGLKDEFSAGGHNRTGETIDSVTVKVGPMSATVSMAGGGWFVEHGFPAHYIEVNTAQALHWESDDKFDEGFARPGVWVSGYEGDPFVERTLDNDINYGIALQTIAEKMFQGIVTASGGAMRFSNAQVFANDAKAMDIATQDTVNYEAIANEVTS